MTEHTMDLVRELRGNKCRCGEGKPSGKTFCYNCYHSLPDELKKRLYKRIGQGYEEAHAEAVAILKGD